MSNKNAPWSDRWEIVRPLSGGGQGKTSLVRSVAGESQLGVLKELKNNKNEQARARMRMEVTNLDALSYEGIKVPKVLGSNLDQFKELRTQLYFVMSYIDGKTLDDTVNERGPLDLDTAASMLFDLSSTVSAAHEQGVYHRDLKPANIMVRTIDPPDLVIVDYGLSFNSEDAEATTVTQPGERFRNEFLSLGETNTPSGNKRDPRIDITALSAVLYFMLTGQPPVQLADGHGRLPHRRDAPFGLRSYLDQDSRRAQIEVLFDRGFALSVNERFQTCRDLTDRLASILDSRKDKRETPMERLAEFKRRLEVGDRKTQLEKLRVASQQVVSVVQQRIIQEYHHKIQPLEITGSGGGEQNLAAGMERLNAGIVIIMSFPLHNIAREIPVGFAAQGNQALMLGAVAARGSHLHGVVPAWKELLWFTPPELPEEASVVERMEELLNEAIDQIEAEATGGPGAPGTSSNQSH